MSRRALLSGWTLVIALVLATQFSATVEALSPRVNPKPLYIALGDSYSSGDGLAPYLAGSGSCDRSPEAYPNLTGRTCPKKNPESPNCRKGTLKACR